MYKFLELDQSNILSHCKDITYHAIPEILRSKPFENIVGKGQNASNQYFLLFPQCFLSFSPAMFSTLFKTIFYILITFVVCKCIESIDTSKFCCSVKS